MVPLLEVYDASTGADVPVGTARFTLRRGAVSTTFAYDEAYLVRGWESYSIDPALPLAAGPQHCEGLPGAFRDAAPDRWGRRLIDRAHREKAAERDAAPRKLDEADYLAGVFDRTREGALRFAVPGQGFVSASGPVPPVVQLPALMDAARQVVDDSAGWQQVKELLDAGSGSLGGARPKASVCDDGRLLLAKFSHQNDDWDVVGWEKTMLDLAEAAGIPVPSSRLVRIGRQSALVLERFDREDSLLEGRRIPYMSAMTVLGAADGEGRDYAELAEATADLAGHVNGELRDLFRRVAFSVAVNNTDDHLRNWGFLRREGKWQLSPLFDVNPNPYEGATRVTAVLGETGDRAAQALRDLAAYTGLDAEQAAAVVSEVLAAAGRWKTAARKNGIKEKEITLFVPAFARSAKALRAAFGV